MADKRSGQGDGHVGRGLFVGVRDSTPTRARYRHVTRPKCLSAASVIAVETHVRRWRAILVWGSTLPPHPRELEQRPLVRFPTSGKRKAAVRAV